MGVSLLVPGTNLSSDFLLIKKKVLQNHHYWNIHIIPLCVFFFTLKHIFILHPFF